MAKTRQPCMDVTFRKRAARDAPERLAIFAETLLANHTFCMSLHQRTRQSGEEHRLAPSSYTLRCEWANLNRGQYIYKLTKTHLKQTQTYVKVGFNFTFGADQPQQDRARSMFTAPPRPIQSPSPYLNSARNQETHQSMGPPSSRPNNRLVIDPALTSPVSTPPNNREHSTQSTEPIGEGKIDVQERNLILQKLEEQDNKLTRMSESMDDWKIQNGRLLAALLRSTPQALNQQDTSGPLEALIKDFESMINAAYDARSGNEDLEVLRAENENMKTKLQTIALAMGSVTRNTTPTSQVFASPITAASTSSVLGKRKRVDARSRHSLLQNEVSYADEDGLNDQSGLYTVSNASNSNSTPARQSKRPSARSDAEQVTVPVTVEPSKMTAQVLSPPDSNFAGHHGRESRSTEPDRSSDVENERSGNTAPAVRESMVEPNVNSGPSENTYAPELLERQATAPTNSEDAATYSHEISSQVGGPQRARNPTPNIVSAIAYDDFENVEMDATKHHTGRALPAERETIGFQNRETRNALRRGTTRILPDEAGGEQEIHETSRETEQRRKTTNTLPEKVNVCTGYGAESSRPTGPQRMTRASGSLLEYEQEMDGASGYAEVYQGMSEVPAEEDVGQDTSLVTMNDDEEREELFERHQTYQHATQMNGSNKENEYPVYAHSTDSIQNKQPSRRNRDPNRPKRLRRKPEEIERKYQCLFPGCSKAYGELPHLNTHIGDSGHGERWTKHDYLEACRQGNNVGEIDRTAGTQDDFLRTTSTQGNGIGVARLAERRKAEEASAALQKNQARVEGEDKIRQRDRMAKEAMEREEMMETDV